MFVLEGWIVVGHDGGRRIRGAVAQAVLMLLTPLKI
jgi:hypothetical protein